MTTNYHTPIPSSPKQPANAATVNGPLGQLDTELVAQDARLDQLEADMPVPSGVAEEFYNGQGGWTVPSGTGSTNGHVIQDDGVDVPQRTKLNFTGTAVTVTDTPGATLVDITAAMPTTTAENDVVVGNGAGAWIKKTLAEFLTIIGKAAAGGLASLDGSSRVVQDPANATTTPTASKIPIAGNNGKLDGWVPFSKGHLFGLELSNNSIDPTNDIDISEGECRDIANAADIVLASPLTKRLDASWVVGSDNGGLDRGAVTDREAAVTVTIASPAVFSWTGHPLVAGMKIVFATTGALPTGLTAGQTYFVISAGLTANAFEVSATPGGSAINTSGSQSGTHTGKIETTYHKHLIRRSDTGVVDALFSLSHDRRETVTVTIASPCVVTWVGRKAEGHGFVPGSTFKFSTTGALPTGITAGTVYYVISAGYSATTFQFSETPGGSAVNTSGSQSGVHTGIGVPYLPAEYASYRRIGSIVRANGVIKAFVQDNDKYSWKIPVNNVTVTNPGILAVTRTLTVPTGIRVEAILGVAISATAVTDGAGGVFISDLSIPDTAPDPTCFSIYDYIQGAGVGQTIVGLLTKVFTNASGQVRSRLTASGTGTILYVNTQGWIDTRGRLG